MKYTKEKALKEIQRRAKAIRQKQDRKITNILATTACISLTALFAVIGVFAGSEITIAQTEYGALILSSEAGGFLLTAVVGFTLGVLVTIGVKRLKKKKHILLTKRSRT